LVVAGYLGSLALLMTRTLIRNITAGLLLLGGMLTLVLPIAFAAAREGIYVTGAQGLLLLAAAWFLYKRHRLAVLALAISAGTYFVGGWYAAASHNISVLELIPAFYWSLAIRVLLVVLIFYLVDGHAPNSEC